MHYLGLDIGGTKVAAGVVTRDGAVLSRVQEATADLRRGGDPLTEIVRLGRHAVREAGGGRVRGVGAALPGPVDRTGPRMLAAPTIPELTNVALEGPLREAFGCPVAGDNDANGCALAESMFGAGRGREHVVYLTVSTGIGGGVVIRGRLLRGARGTSAEFGHQVILPDGGPTCACGGRGCLETLASGTAIAARARVLFGGNDEPLEALTAEWVAERVHTGDERAVRLWTEVASYLGAGISNIINILDPDVVVLGGGVSTGAGELLLAPVRRYVSERCMPSLARDVSILEAQLGSEAGIVGAACLVMEMEAERDGD